MISPWLREVFQVGYVFTNVSGRVPGSGGGWRPEPLRAWGQRSVGVPATLGREDQLLGEVKTGGLRFGQRYNNTYMYIYIYMYLYLYIYIYIHTYICTYTYQTISNTWEGEDWWLTD